MAEMEKQFGDGSAGKLNVIKTPLTPVPPPSEFGGEAFKRAFPEFDLSKLSPDAMAERSAEGRRAIAARVARQRGLQVTEIVA